MPLVGTQPGGNIQGNWDVYFPMNQLEWVIGSPSLAPLDFEIYSFDLDRLFTGKTDFKVIFHSNTLNGNVNISGNVIENGVTITESTLTSNNFYQFLFNSFVGQNPDLYTIELYFDLYGKNSSGTFVKLDSRSYNVNVLIKQSQSTMLKTENEIYTLVYNRANNTLGGETAIHIINNNNSELLKFTNASNLFTQVENFSTDFNITENSNFRISDDTSLPNEGVVTLEAYLSKWDATNSVWIKFYIFQIKLIIVTDDIVVTPSSEEIELIKAQNEIKSVTLTIANPFNKSFTLQGPSWLTFSESSGNTTKDIIVSTIASGQLSIGEVMGNIVVIYDTKTKVVPIKLRVVDFIVSSINEDYNFCLDNKNLIIYRRNSNARFVSTDFTVKMQVGSRIENFTLPIIIPYFDNKAIIKLGEKIHGHFYKYRDSILEEVVSVTANNKFLLAPAIITGKIRELDVEYKEVYSENIETITLYPGKKPLAFPIISNFLKRSRREGSAYIFSYLNSLFNVNQLLDITLSPNYWLEGSIERVKIEDSESKIFFPTVKSISFATNKAIEIITLPEGANIINVEFLNSNFAKEWATFTGEYKVTHEFSHRYSQNVINSLQEKFSTDNIKTLSVNTGYILKDEIPLIEAIIESKLCHFKIEGKLYKGFSTSQKMPNIDSSQELIQIDLEFLIIENGN